MAGGRYVPLLRLSSGPTEVWFALLEGAEGFRRPLVVKVVRASSHSEQARRDLIREAFVGGALAHPNVAQVFELFEEDDALALAIEHVPGLSLRALLIELARTEGRVPWPIAARIVADAAAGLAHAHEALGPDGAPLGLVHRDVGPANLLVGETGWTKVLDFGIARSPFAEATVGHVVRGTPGYLSPEQAAGHPVDWRSDVFSLGAVLYELVVGLPLIHGPSERAFHDLAQRGPVIEGDVPPPIRDLMLRMLAIESSRRMLPMNEIAEQLEGAAIGKGGAHRDVASFLRSEVEPLLARRRARVRAWMAGGAQHVARAIEPSTLYVLERALDDAHPPIDDAIADTFAELAEHESTEIDSGRRP